MSTSVYQKFGKRVMDILVSLAGSLLLWPLLLVIALLIKLDSPGSVIFRQKRAGKGGKPFTFYKFRTMVVNAEQLKAKYTKLNQADGPAFKIRNDPRHTKLGRLLSHTGLDELPQLINILKGEMSLVGPRPLPLNEEEKIPLKYQVIRRSVRPGLACSWLINGAHKLSFEKWMQFDIEDIRKVGLCYDFKILFSTVSCGLRFARDELIIS